MKLLDRFRCVDSGVPVPLPKQKMKVYHFCAMTQGIDAGQLRYMDGIYTGNITDIIPYEALKESLRVKFNLPDKEVVILSLTVIGEG